MNLNSRLRKKCHADLYDRKWLQVKFEMSQFNAFNDRFCNEDVSITSA